MGTRFHDITIKAEADNAVISLKSPQARNAMNRLLSNPFRSLARSTTTAARNLLSHPNTLDMATSLSAAQRTTAGAVMGTSLAWSMPSLARSISIVGISNPKQKIKTHKGTAKRWAALPSGQYKRGRPGKRHLNVTLTSVRLNRLGQTAYASPAQKKQLKRLLPGQ